SSVAVEAAMGGDSRRARSGTRATASLPLLDRSTAHERARVALEPRRERTHRFERLAQRDQRLFELTALPAELAGGRIDARGRAADRARRLRELGVVDRQPERARRLVEARDRALEPAVVATDPVRDVAQRAQRLLRFHQRILQLVRELRQLRPEL